MRRLKSFLLIIPLLVISFIIIRFLASFFLITASQSPESETLLTESVSPDGTYSIKAFRTNPGATVDFSIRCYVSSKEYTGKIYDAYHEATVRIEWISNDIISINGKRIDLSKKEAYSWKNNGRKTLFKSSN